MLKDISEVVGYPVLIPNQNSFKYYLMKLKSARPTAVFKIKHPDTRQFKEMPINALILKDDAGK